MINLVLDSNNLFFRSLYIIGGFGKKQYTFDSEEEINQLMRKIMIDITSIIRKVNSSRVIFAVDDKSWRKDISIDENEGYKANRKKSDFINWNNVFGIFDEFLKICENNGSIISKIKGAEADDIFSLFKKEFLFNKKEHVILVSGDEDVRQLVDSNENIFSVVYNPFTMGRNPTKKLFVPDHFQKWFNDEEDIGDIFNRSINVDKEDFQRIIQTDKVKVEYINGNKIALRKMFCGDDGDNVPSIYSWINDKDKKIRITPAKFQKIIDYIGAKTYLDLFDESKIDSIYDQLVEISGQRPSFKIFDRLRRQAKLVVLDQALFPKKIVEKFNEGVKEKFKKSQIRPQSWNMLSMLEGTQYIDAKGKLSFSNESSIFEQVDRISNKELF